MPPDGPPWFGWGAAAQPRDGRLFARRRPRAGIAVILALISIGGTFGAWHAQHAGPRLAPGAALLALVTPVAILALLPRFPRTATLASAAATFTYVALGYPWGPVVFSGIVLLFLVMLTGEARQARVLSGAGATLLFGAVVGAGTLREHPPAVGSLLGGAAWAAVVLLMANGMRERSARFAEARAAQARSLAERQSAAVAAERLRIAREMHDVLAHSLSAISVQAGMGLHLLDRDPAQARTALTNIRATSAEALDEVRAVLGVVRDGEAPLAPTWNLEALPRLVALAGTERLTATLDVDPQAHDLPERLAGVVYRVAQEALTNVRRHAPGASRAQVRVVVGGAGPARSVTVSVDDDGGVASTGPTTGGSSRAAPGFGLLGMRERVEDAGGTFEAAPTAAGWRVRATVPWPDQERDLA